MTSHCKECDGRGEVETGIGMMVCTVCHGSRNSDLFDAATKALGLLTDIREIMKTSEYYDSVVLDLERALKS